MIHGGVLASLVDSTCACAAFSLILPNGYATTIDLQVEFLKPVSSGRLKAKAKCIKSGKNIFFCKQKFGPKMEILYVQEAPNFPELNDLINTYRKLLLFFSYFLSYNLLHLSKKNIE